jgi:hypothetical protein
MIKRKHCFNLSESWKLSYVIISRDFNSYSFYSIDLAFEFMGCSEDLSKGSRSNHFNTRETISEFMILENYLIIILRLYDITRTSFEINKKLFRHLLKDFLLSNNIDLLLKDTIGIFLILVLLALLNRGFILSSFNSL